MRTFVHIFLSAAICLLAAEMATAQAPRSVTVVSKPDSSVWIGGVFYGKTDAEGKLTVKTAARGERSIRVRTKGFSDATALIPVGTASVTVEVLVTKPASPAELAFQEGEIQAGLDRAKAIAAFSEAVKLDPKFIAAHIALARNYAEGSRPDEAVKVLARLKTLSPGNAEASAVEGRTLKDIGEEEKAIAAFKRAITLGRGFQPEAYTGLGLLYKEKAEMLAGEDEVRAEAAFNEATKHLSTAVKQLAGAPDAVTIMQLLGLLYEGQKKYQQAIAVYREFLELFPDSPEAEAVRSFIVQINKEIERQN